MTKKISKHHNDLVNAKLIPSVLPDYIPPLAGVISRDSVLRDFNYTLINTYLPKGIHVVKPQLERILMLKISDFNLRDRKNYGMLAPHKYLTKTMGKKLKIIPQSWTMDIARSTILNMMKLPHFGRHQEVNMCVKLLLPCYHCGYLWLDRRIIVDPVLFHQITGLRMKGPDPQDFYRGKAADHALAQQIKDTYGDVEKGKKGYKVTSIQNGTVHLACQLIIGKLVRKNRPTQVTRFVVDLTGNVIG
jgi:hypothetical protein